MSMLGPMRNELFKYRRHKGTSINGAAPGIPYIPFRKSMSSPLGSPHISRSSGYNHDLYMWGNHREYIPWLNSPAVQENEYESYEPLEVRHFHRNTNPKLPIELQDQDNIEIPHAFILPKDDLSLTEQFLMAMGKRGEIEQVSLDEPRFNIHPPDIDEAIDTAAVAMTDSAELTADDVAHKLIDLLDAFHHLKTVFPEDHQDIVNLKGALHDLINDTEAMSKLESLAGDVGPSRLGKDNPYQNDDIIEQGKDYFEEADSMDYRVMEHLDLPLMQMEAPPLFDEIEPSPMPAEQNIMPAGDYADIPSLEQIVENEAVFEEQVRFAPDDMMQMMEFNDAGMAGPMGPDVGFSEPEAAFNEINQAIDQIQQQTEPDQMQMQYGPTMMLEYMFDPIQQFMPDYMAPGFGPMNPGFGPMGPMPM